MTHSAAADVFISYAHQDQHYADLLKGHLLAGDHNVWSDGDIKAGEDWADAIARALEESNIVLLLLSPRYFESKSALYEAGLALGKMRHNEGKVIGILVDNADPLSSTPLSKISLLDARSLNQNEIFRELDIMIKTIS